MCKSNICKSRFAVTVIFWMERDKKENVGVTWPYNDICKKEGNDLEMHHLWVFNSVKRMKIMKKYYILNIMNENFLKHYVRYYIIH